MVDGRRLTVTREKAEFVWDVFNGKVKPDAKQRKFCERVEDVIFSWRNAPDEYIQANLKKIIPMAVSSWRVNRSGQHTRPDTNQDWEFAKRWGLWENGPTMLVPNRAPVEVSHTTLPVDFSEPTNQKGKL
jgi:hypothetical protein